MGDAMTGRVYKIFNKEDQLLCYIGSTTLPLKQRFQIHKTLCDKGMKSPLYRAMKGCANNWEIVLMEEIQFENVNTLRKKEDEYIQQQKRLGFIVLNKKRAFVDLLEGENGWKNWYRHFGREYYKNYRLRV